MKDGEMVYEGRPLKFIGTGLSRMAYSDGAGICVKVPVKGRTKAGILQNKEEAACLKLGEWLGIFPKLKSISKDGKALAVEECDCVLKSGELADFMKYNEEILIASGNVPVSDFGCNTAVMRVAWGLRPLDFFANRLDIAPNALLSHLEKSSTSTFDAQTCNDFKISAFLLRRAIEGQTDSWTKLVRFWLAHRDRVVLQEMWHCGQWGIRKSTRGFVVLDAGFTKYTQSTDHYRRDGVLLPPDKAETGREGYFCGKPFADIVSPKGKPVKYSFKTSKGSEYVLTEDRMSQRVKKAGLPDDGLHRWMDRSVFVEYSDLEKIMNELRNNNVEQRPTRLVESGVKWLAFQTLASDGEWRSTLTIKDASRVPVKGRHVCEFMFDGNRIVKACHPGHDVTEVTELKC